MPAPLVAAVVVAALALSAAGGWPVVSLVLRLASRSHDAGRPGHAGAHALSTATPTPTATPSADGGPGAAPTDAAAGTAQPAAPARTAVATADPQAAPAGPHPSPLAVSDGPQGEGAQAVLRGGTWVGILERLAVTGCFLVGEAGGIAVVVAVKGLGRYPELRENPGASERFVIGTLASLLWSAAVGFGAAWALTL
ncbi:hypothetical protein OMK64_04480 [Cellulomonas fimi]|uniref:hypothetical protein n=1 Tax=Cellulomonas fimi TaxID=1708 RepID=UPI00234C6DF3|nr:hypothetical protein [Cellulomonas fimi]MDC7120786.1 hypothetical protein [Cellulomonas fimi]